MIICGVDPGLSGAICFLSDTCVTHDMPTLNLTRGGKNKREIDPHALGNMLWKSHAGHAFVEQVGAMPGQGVTSMFAMGKGYGIIIGVLATVGIPYTFVSPQRWKKSLGVPAAKDGARARASQLLPDAAEQWRLVKHDGRAEAALICLWGRASLNAIASYDPVQDGIGSHNDAIAEIGRRVASGEEDPPTTGYFASKAGGAR